ncbi:MAG: hypothetical protein ACM3NQ_06670 [Bacteroidales bacterium]
MTRLLRRWRCGRCCWAWAPLSPVAFGLTGLLVLAVVLLACAVPAARAASADPAAALRAQ